MMPDKTVGALIELEKSVFLIPGRKTGGCNVFLLKGTQKNVLIDVGLPDDYDYLCASLALAGLGIDDIHMVLVSHEHIDHVGGLPHLPRRIVVAAHGRAANKFALNDQFSMMSGIFKTQAASFHVDVHLEDGTLIDIGGLQLRTIYTPGHCSGAVCFLEPQRGALFTADTIFAGGILGGIFASGNTSDYINSLERLREFRLENMYPGHGRMSSTPDPDIERAIIGSRLLMTDTQTLFDAIHIGEAFNSIKHATVDYSRRAPERRQSSRVSASPPALVHLPDDVHRINTLNISLHGILLDRELPLAKGENLRVTLEGIGNFECKVVSHPSHHTRLAILDTKGDTENLAVWLEENRRKKTK